VSRALAGLPFELAEFDPADVPPGTTHAARLVDASDSFSAGVAVHRLRCALASEGLGAVWLDGTLAIGPM
jgi:hypothetical protein